jgi:hypothetical protein
MTVEHVLKATREYYRDNPCGGSLHVAVDDGNLEDLTLDLCENYALEDHDEAGMNLARMWKGLTLEEREALYKRYREYCG